MLTRTISRASMYYGAKTIQLLKEEDPKVAFSDCECLYKPSEAHLSEACDTAQKACALFKKRYLVTERVLTDRTTVVSAEWSARGVDAPTPVLNTLHIGEIMIKLFTKPVNGVRLVDALDEATSNRVAFSGFSNVPTSEDIIQAGFLNPLRELIKGYSGMFIEGYKFTGTELATLSGLIGNILKSSIFNSASKDVGKTTSVPGAVIVESYKPFTLAAFYLDWLKKIEALFPIWKPADSAKLNAGGRVPEATIASSHLSSVTTSIKYDNFEEVDIPEFLGDASYDVIKRIITTELWFDYLRSRSGSSHKDLQLYVRDPKTKKISLNFKVLEEVALTMKNDLAEKYIPFIKQVIDFKKKEDLCVDTVGYYVLNCVQNQQDIPQEFRKLMVLFEDKLIAKNFVNKAYTYAATDDLKIQAEACLRETKPLLDKIVAVIDRIYNPLTYDALGRYTSYMAWNQDTPFIYRLEEQKGERDPNVLLTVDLLTSLVEVEAGDADVKLDNGRLPWKIEVSPSDTSLTLAKKNIEELSIQECLLNVPTADKQLWQNLSKGPILVKADVASIITKLRELGSFYEASFKDDSKIVLVEKKEAVYNLKAPKNKGQTVRLGSSGGYCSETNEFTIDRVDLSKTTDPIILLTSFVGRDVLNKTQTDLRGLYEGRIKLLTGGNNHMVLSTIYNTASGATSIDEFATFVSNFLGDPEEAKVLTRYFAKLWLPYQVRSKNINKNTDPTSGVRYDPPCEVCLSERAVTVTVPIFRTFLPRHIDEFFNNNKDGCYKVGATILESSYVSDSVSLDKPTRISLRIDPENKNIVLCSYTVDLVNDVVFAGKKASKVLVFDSEKNEHKGISFDVKYPTSVVNRPPLSRTRVRVLNSKGLVPVGKAFKDLGHIDKDKTIVQNATAIIKDEVSSFIGLTYPFNSAKAALYKPWPFVVDLVRYAQILESNYDIDNTTGYDVGLYTSDTLREFIANIIMLRDKIQRAILAGIRQFTRDCDAVMYALELYKAFFGVEYSEKDSYLTEVFPSCAYDSGLIDVVTNELNNPMYSPIIVESLLVHDVDSICSESFAGIVKAYIENYVDTWIRGRLDLGSHGMTVDGVATCFSDVPDFEEKDYDSVIKELSRATSDVAIELDVSALKKKQYEAFCKLYLQLYAATCPYTQEQVKAFKDYVFVINKDVDEIIKFLDGEKIPYTRLEEKPAIKGERLVPVYNNRLSLDEAKKAGYETE